MRRGLAAAAAAGALLFAAPVAHAAPPNPPVVTGGTISVSMSSGNTNPPLLSGHFHVDDSGAAVTVKATMAWTGPAPDQHPKFNPQDVCPGAKCANDGNGNIDFSGFGLPTATYNGPYRVDATAAASDIFGSGAQAVNTAFHVAVAPPDVGAVTATVDNKTRQVTVSWDRDITTPDLVAYWIWRKGPGDADFKAVIQTPQLSTGARVSVVDYCQDCNGGDYLYQVESRRNGGDAQYSSTDFVASNRSKSQSPKVTEPPPPPGQTVPPTTAPGPGGGPPVVRGTPSGTTHSAGFSGGSGGSSSAATPTSEAVTPDPGFARGLPYAGGSSANDQNGEEGDNSAVAVTPGRHTSSGKGYLVPVAAGAVLFLGALHLRMFKKRLDEPPTSSLTPVA